MEGAATGRGRGEGSKARTDSAAAAPVAVAIAEAGMRVAVKWETRWAPETDGWVEVLRPPLARSSLSALSYLSSRLSKAA